MVVKNTGGDHLQVSLDHPQRKGEFTQYPWELLLCYLEIPGAELDNNSTENAWRSVVMGRQMSARVAGGRVRTGRKPVYLDGKRPSSGRGTLLVPA